MVKIAPIILSKYRPHWVEAFVNEAKRIQNAIGDFIVAVEHIGSTAIPGSLAKPEIDIMVGVKTLRDAELCIEPLQEIGYVYFPQFEKFVPERRYFRKSRGITPLFHVHMVEKLSSFWLDHILFRDYLRSHSEVIQEYNKLKQDLILEFGGDRKSYGAEKEKFVLKILKIAQIGSGRGE